METTRTLMLMLLLLCTPIHRSITITVTIILVSLRSINQSIDRKSNSQVIIIIIKQQQPRTTSSGSMIESMLTKRQRDTKRATMHQQERVTHLDLESIEQSLACRRGALVYCCEPDGRRIIVREREREAERVRAALV